MFWKRGQRQATITVRTPPARNARFANVLAQVRTARFHLRLAFVRSPPTRNTRLTNVLAHLHATPTPPARRIHPKAACAARPLANVLARPHQRVSFHGLLRNVCSADVPLRRLTKS